MKVITGLGNPGGEYAQSRHNIGFVLADILADGLNLDFRSRFQGLLAEGLWQGEKVLLFKPMTYMNLSGRAVRELLRFYKVPSESVLVVHDDLDLPAGRIRLRSSGGSGGHNGIRSIIEEIGSEDFWRLRIGIGRPPEGWETARYVLAPFFREEECVIDQALTRAEAALKLWLNGEAAKAMNIYNRN